jgi:hypothetical protein
MLFLGSVLFGFGLWGTFRVFSMSLIQCAETALFEGGGIFIEPTIYPRRHYLLNVPGSRLLTG